MSEARSGEWLAQWEYAHRGLHGDALHGAGAPENSLGAAEAAIACGLAIECDVQMSRDGVPMVFHDWCLDRLTPTTGPLADYTERELVTMRLAATDQTIPSLARFLALVGARVPLLVEVKSKPDHLPEQGLEAVVSAISAYLGPLALMSFDPRICGWLRRHVPQIVRGLVGTDSYRNGFEGMWRNKTTLDEALPDFLAVDYRDLAKPEGARWRAGGKPLLTWTVRSPEQRLAARELADALIVEGHGLA